MEGIKPGGKSKRRVSVHWYRHGMRLHDNPALLKALQDTDEFYPIFIFDGEVAGMSTAAYTRMRFAMECLQDLDESFKQNGTRLFCFHGTPFEIINMLIKEWGMTRLTFEQDPEPIWRKRDNEVKVLCAKYNVEVIEEVSHTLWDPKKIIEANGGWPPHTYSLFNQVVSTIGAPPRPVKYPDFKSSTLRVPENYDEKFAIPSMKNLGAEPESKAQENPVYKWKGGEKKALELLNNRLQIERNAYVKGHIMPNQYEPDLVGEPKSMSPHLRFGCLSIRKFYWDIHDAYKQVYADEEPPSNLSAQCIWREYFYCMSHNNIVFNQVEGNPICLQIPWYKNEEHLQMWTEGRTGYPWIDACMRQLTTEGWLHHVGRHAVSCFLTRGDLWISWEDGLKVFDKYLLDGDWSVCAGNWMWVSSSAFENCLQCPNCFSPVLYGMRMDPTGEYVRRYCPELKKMPLRYLFQPWKASREIQEKADCIVGRDYPMPMVDHRKASADCKRRMEEFKNHFKGPDRRHVMPSNVREVLQFCWLPTTMAAAQSDHLCQGIEGL